MLPGNSRSARNVCAALLLRCVAPWRPPVVVASVLWAEALGLSGMRCVVVFYHGAHRAQDSKDRQQRRALKGQQIVRVCLQERSQQHQLCKNVSMNVGTLASACCVIVLAIPAILNTTVVVANGRNVKTP